MNAFDVLEDVKRRTAEAIIAQSGLSHEGLRRNLRELLTGTDVRAGALLQEPVIEGAHPFISADVTLDGLSGSLLHRDLVQALDDLEEDHDYRFPRSRKPFKHQLEAWRLLTDREPKSVVVTSGTGSGKTECFLFPVLSDLAAQAEGRREPLDGVQAIMLYPLNALIESQQERLSAWTRPFNGLIRYGLYNGDMPGTESEATRRRVPQQVIDRERLRKAPPPLLVTNVTMLEYMLVRAEDQPIVDMSRGKLKWIVLDEAHSLVGAAAAEIALLLRRTMLAFGVRAEDVRFVATSATIGSGDETRAQLQQFLADVAGVPENRVHVVEGSRKLPGRPGEPAPAPVAGELRTATAARLYDLLGGDAQTWALVERLFNGGVLLSDFAAAAKTFGVTASDLVSALSRAARTSPTGEEERLAPMRLHAFERAVPGLWSCINRSCTGQVADWPFGATLADRADRCPHCGAPVLEVISCTECGEVYLEGIETGTHLTAPVRNPPRDEFAFDGARDTDAGSDTIDGDDDDAESDVEDTGSGAIAVSLDHLFAASPTQSARSCWVEPDDGGWRVVDGATAHSVVLKSEHHSGSRACPHCTPGGGSKEILRPVRFGAPFIVGNTAPLLLEALAPAQALPGERLPSGGRRLLSFTDSRQGTARMAAKLQIESERNFVRSFIYHQVQASMQAGLGSEAEMVRLQTAIAKLEEMGAADSTSPLASVLASQKAELTRLSGEGVHGVPWNDLVQRLAARPEVSEWMLGVWQARDEEFFSDSYKLAGFLLLREFARRPRRANSIETLGLAQLRHPALDRLGEAHLPASFRRHGRTLLDWQCYLQAILTWFVRANGAIAIGWQAQHWIAPKAQLTSLVGPDRTKGGDSKLRAWPNGHFRASPRSRPVAFLLRGLSLSLESAADRDDLDECLHAAWNQVQATFSPDPERRVFDFPKAFVAPISEGFFCPVTRRMLDCSPFGLTPYGLDDPSEKQRQAVPMAMPKHPVPMLGDVDLDQARATTRDWLETDAAIAGLREKGAWTNISDRIALFSDYARSAEHSAQQESRRLRKYESEFKAGRINILNCSTTMEMGVDIGSVSSVMMTNVPPSIANYRQRVGRAGRRGQALALAFTFCKDRPLDREAFLDPQAFLQRSLAAPKVTLSSRPIVQRHVNAYLLGSFMRERSGDPLKMQVGAFLGCPADPKLARMPRNERPIADFMDWLGQPSTAANYQDGIESLTRRSVLEHDGGLADATIEAIKYVETRFLDEWMGLVTLAKDEDLRDAGKSRMAIELKRLCGEFLLGGLADRGFLPGHGFPTDVVSFMPGKEFKLPDSEPADGRRQFRSVGPQRSLDIAIRDYAPGSEVVLDGLVHRSAGVTLNWKRPATEENLAEIQSLRHHWRCPECGESDVSRPPEACPGCGSAQLKTTAFLRPAGFSVDPRVRAHADTDALAYVAPEDPVVSARGAYWQSLPLPELGRYRCSREGLVFFCNKGGHGNNGFEICLECGRAEAFDHVATRSALADHKPLRYRKGMDRCPGNDKPFAIQRVSLGMEITTDVFELQLPRRLSRPAAHALVIALREALSGELGVEADEIGFAVGEGRTALGGPAVSLFLFDRATGGAGFSVSLEHLVRPVLERAERILDCRTPGCVRGCAACVLTADAPGGKDDLDRQAAYEYVCQHLTIPSGLAIEDRFVEQAELSLSMADEIHRELNRSSRSDLTIFLSSGQSPSDLSEWPLANSHFRAWSKAGHRLRLVLPQSYVSQLSTADGLTLRDFALRYDLLLATGLPPSFGNGAITLAAIGHGSDTRHLWATREMEPCLARESWGRPKDLPLARAAATVPLAVEPIRLETLLPRSGAQYVQLTRELDGDMATFGTRAADAILRLLSGCGAALTGRTISATYRDPFVSSPLVARLMLDTVGQLFGRSGAANGKLVVETRMPQGDMSRGNPWQIGHDWRHATDQKLVIELLGKRRDLDVHVRHAEVPHGRYLTLELDNGDCLTIVLDQGFGAWAPRRGVSVRHDFDAPPLDQAKRLATLNALLERRGVGVTYVVASAGPDVH